MLGNREDAEDVIQETFIKAFKSDSLSHVKADEISGRSVN
jgi:DNA-directed RNA polymerase specialized sigma24 family protein